MIKQPVLYVACVCLPAGKISEQEVVVQFLALLAAGIGTSVLLDKWAGHEFPIMLVLTLFGSVISYIYSAPPLKLKQSGWIGNYALGSSYIALPWWAGQVGTGCCALAHQTYRCQLHSGSSSGCNALPCGQDCHGLLLCIDLMLMSLQLHNGSSTTVLPCGQNR